MKTFGLDSPIRCVVRELRSALMPRFGGDSIKLILGVGFMPLCWTIDSKERLFTGSGEGDVTFADAMDALAGARALSYRKLFDGRAVQSSMTGEELLALCARIRGYHEQGPVGALAIVGTNEQFETFARLMGVLAAADRPMRMFTGLRLARIWLGEQRT